MMRIRLGCELAFEFAYPTPMIMMLNVHYSRSADLERPDLITTDPPVPTEGFRDTFGNWCTRALAPPGRFVVTVDSVIRDQGEWDSVAPDAAQHAVEDLPTDTLGFLLASRYCESDALSNEAWFLFGNTPPGWARVKAIVDFVHQHIAFDYQEARDTRTAAEVYAEKKGVCRDYAHLAVAFCRAMNIPARYCTGYISDIGLVPPFGPGRFRGLDGGLSRRPLARLRSTQQRAAQGPRADGLRPRRRRRVADPYVRPEHPDGFPRMDGRGRLTPATAQPHAAVHVPGALASPSPRARWTMMLSDQCPNLKATAGSTPTRRKPQASCSLSEAALAPSI